MDRALHGNSFGQGTASIFLKLVMLALTMWPAGSCIWSLSKSHTLCAILVKDQVAILFSHEFIYIDVKGKLMIQVSERLLLNAIFFTVQCLPALIYFL